MFILPSSSEELCERFLVSVAYCGQEQELSCTTCVHILTSVIPAWSRGYIVRYYYYYCAISGLILHHLFTTGQIRLATITMWIFIADLHNRMCRVVGFKTSRAFI